ncbi:MAG: type II 3-dehydroquinate dehydratase [Janthinobacterium lividum]
MQPPQVPESTPWKTPHGGTAGAKKTVFVLNGPNMDLLGKRQPELYGRETLDDVRRLCEATAAQHGLSVDFRQSNSEGAIVDAIHAAREDGVAIVINPAAYAHTSIAIQDALHACDDMPIIEVHMTNTWTRESYRHTDYTAQVATAQINGCGVNGYVLAIGQVAYLLEHEQAKSS